MKLAMILIAAALGIPAMPASAQLVPKQVVLDEYAICVARQAPAGTRALLASPMAGPDERAKAEVLVKGHSACLQGRPILSMRSGAIRGALAEVELAQDAGVAATARALPAAMPVRAAKGGDGRAFLIRYGACLVNADPADTLTLLATQPGTQGEHDAFLAYGDVLAECMPEKAEYHVNVTDLRNQLSALLYLKATTKRAGA